MSRPVPDIAVAFVSREENGAPGPRLHAYQDSGGVWTIGTGHTPAHEGQVITEAEATTLLKSDMAIAVQRVGACLPAPVINKLTDNEYAALLSFTFNEGAKADWGVWAAVPHGPMAVAGQLIKFVYSGGEKVQGLVNRRYAEIALYEGRDPLCKTEAAA